MAIDNATRLQYLAALGIDVWIPRDAVNVQERVRHTQPATGSSQLHTDIETAREKPAKACANVMDNWQALQDEVAVCQHCTLSASRTQTVFGTGNQHADWMLIGEAPGQSEDREGKPFVGKAGLLLTEMLRAMGLSREDVFIANILKCRPPNNRDPKIDEVEACADFLQRQIAQVKPKIILAVGRVAAQNLLQTDTPIGKLRGKVYKLGETPVVVIYHPAYLLRSLLEKRKAWVDLQLAMQVFHKIDVSPKSSDENAVSLPI